MFGTEFLAGQGLGNQLFCYVTARCLAEDLGYEFGTANKEYFVQSVRKCTGAYFLDIDLGSNIIKEKCTKYVEHNTRLYVPNSMHDLTYGCDISDTDLNLYNLKDNTIIYGILQSEKYFINHLEDIKNWLKVKPEYDTKEFSKENICILNIRGGEYKGNSELFLNEQYWIVAMNHMLKIKSDMQFIIITDDIEVAKEMFPQIVAYHFDIARDYISIKNAQYLILSNSTFACFPVFTSNTLKYLIAPKYWARYNVSDGYWSSEQNIYTGWNYMDRNGNIFTAEECREELVNYKKYSFYYSKKKSKPNRLICCFYKIKFLFVNWIKREMVR